MRALDALSSAISWVAPHQCPQWSACLPAASCSMDDGMATLLVNGTSVISGNSADIAGGGAYNFGMFTLGSQSVIHEQHGFRSFDAGTIGHGRAKPAPTSGG